MTMMLNEYVNNYDNQHDNHYHDSQYHNNDHNNTNDGSVHVGTCWTQALRYLDGGRVYVLVRVDSFVQFSRYDVCLKTRLILWRFVFVCLPVCVCMGCD